jgi:hypothetical protein
MKSRTRHTVIAVIGIVLCVVAGVLNPWVTGRLGPSHAITGCLFILVFAIVLRGAFRWDVVDFVLGVLGVGGAAFVIVAFLCGLSWIKMLEWRNLLGLLLTCLLIGVPWFLGFGLGSLLLRFSK